MSPVQKDACGFVTQMSLLSHPRTPVFPSCSHTAMGLYPGSFLPPLSPPLGVSIPHNFNVPYSASFLVTL